MHIFYTPDIRTELYTLSEEESKHAIRVLRLTHGSHVNLVDGRGGLYTAEIIDEHPKRTQLRILRSEKEYGKRNHYLHIAIAPTKNIERIEWFLEKATEIGIDEITPIICSRSERREVKTERLEKVVTAAIKQSLKAYHPVINDPVKYEQLAQGSSSAQKFIAHCMESDKSALKDIVKLNSDYLVMIGPEGDFSEPEVKLARENGFAEITLGDSRLRTETAGLAACFEINFLNR